MNFLQLCQAVREGAGISGTGPTSVVNQSGEMLRVVNWVKSAWNDLQLWHDQWTFMRGSFRIDTVVGQRAYPYASAIDVDSGLAISSFDGWLTDEDEITVYLLSEGKASEGWLSEIDYPSFTVSYEFAGNDAITGRPSVFSIRPEDRALLLAVKPDGVYRVTGKYRKGLQALAVNDDEPRIPAEFHPAIVHRALVKYALYENAGETLASARSDFGMYLSRMEDRFLPPMGFGRPLA